MNGGRRGLVGRHGGGARGRGQWCAELWLIIPIQRIPPDVSEWVSRETLCYSAAHGNSSGVEHDYVVHHKWS